MKNLFLLLMAIILVSALILGGCAQTTPASTTTTAPAVTTTTAPAVTTTTTKPAATTTAPTTTTATLTPKYGGTLKWFTDIASMTSIGWPADFFTPSDASASQYCLEGLLRSDGKGNIVPWLAEFYKIADDMKSITLTMRKGVKFHDGTDFNAQAAKWNLENIIAAKKQPTWTSVDLIDDNTIRLNFSSASNLNIYNLIDFYSGWMVSPTAFQKNGLDWMRQNPVGTGPFKFVSYQRDVSFKTVRNPDYWVKDSQGNRLPYLNAVDIYLVSDMMTQKAVMLSGEGDVLETGLDQRAAEMKAVGLVVQVFPSDTRTLTPDTADADSPYAKKEVREAVEYALDRDAIAKAFGYGLFSGGAYQIPAGTSVIYDPKFTLGRKYDPDKAKQLLAQAGYPKGFKTTLLVHMVINKDMAVAVQSYLSKVGIQVELSIPANQGAYNEAMNSLHNCLSFNALPDQGNYNALLLMGFAPSTTYKKLWLRTPEFLKLLDASLASPIADVKLMRAITDYMTQEASVIPVANGGRARVTQPYVANLDFSARDYYGFWNSEWVWLNK